MTDINDTLNERGTRYGEYKDNAVVAQKLKRIWRESEGRVRAEAEFTNSIGASICEGMEMILHKVARICNGDPAYDDNWRDIAGYAQLVLKEIEKHAEVDTEVPAGSKTNPKDNVTCGGSVTVRTAPGRNYPVVGNSGKFRI